MIRNLTLFLFLASACLNSTQNFESLDDFINGSLESLDNITLPESASERNDPLPVSQQSAEKQVDSGGTSKEKQALSEEPPKEVDVGVATVSQKAEDGSKNEEVLESVSNALPENPKKSPKSNLTKMNKVDFYLAVRGNSNQENPNLSRTRYYISVSGIVFYKLGFTDNC